MQYTKEFKAALKIKLEEHEGDYAYQAIFREALDFLEEHEDLVIFDGSITDHQQSSVIEPTNLSHPKNNTNEPTSKGKSSTPHLQLDFSNLENMAKDVLEMEVPETPNLEIKPVSATVELQELEDIKVTPEAQSTEIQPPKATTPPSRTKELIKRQARPVPPVDADKRGKSLNESKVEVVSSQERSTQPHKDEINPEKTEQSEEDEKKLRMAALIAEKRKQAALEEEDDDE